MDPALSHKVRRTLSFFQNSTVNQLERRAAAETWRSGVLGSSRASLAPVPAPAPVSRRDKTAANVAATSFGVQPYNSPHQTELGQVRASVYRTTTSDSRREPSSQWLLPPPKTTRPQDRTDVQRCLWALFFCRGKSRGRNRAARGQRGNMAVPWASYDLMELPGVLGFKRGLVLLSTCLT